MADNDNRPKADKHGNTILVPIAMVAVFVVLVGLMMMRTEETAPTPPPGHITTYDHKQVIDALTISA